MMINFLESVLSDRVLDILLVIYHCLLTQFRDGYGWPHWLGQQNHEECNRTVLPCSDTKGGGLQKTWGPGAKQSTTYRVLQVPAAGDATQVCICLILPGFKGILVIKTGENRIENFQHKWFICAM